MVKRFSWHVWGGGGNHSVLCNTYIPETDLADGELFLVNEDTIVPPLYVVVHVAVTVGVESAVTAVHLTACALLSPIVTSPACKHATLYHGNNRHSYLYNHSFFRHRVV